MYYHQGNHVLVDGYAIFDVNNTNWLRSWMMHAQVNDDIACWLSILKLETLASPVAELSRHITAIQVILSFPHHVAISILITCSQCKLCLSLFRLPSALNQKIALTGSSSSSLITWSNDSYMCSLRFPWCNPFYPHPSGRLHLSYPLSWSHLGMDISATCILHSCLLLTAKYFSSCDILYHSLNLCVHPCQ